MQGIDKILENINTRLMPQHLGKIVAIEPETGKYFIGDSEIQAYKLAAKEFPHRIFIFKRIGFKATHFVGAF